MQHTTNMVLSDASPDVEGIETMTISHALPDFDKSYASPDVEGIETPAPHTNAVVIAQGSYASPDVEGIETIRCNFESKQILSYASPDAEGIETKHFFFAPSVVLGQMHRPMLRALKLDILGKAK